MMTKSRCSVYAFSIGCKEKFLFPRDSRQMQLTFMVFSSVQQEELHSYSPPGETHLNYSRSRPRLRTNEYSLVLFRDFDINKGVL